MSDERRGRHHFSVEALIIAGIGAIAFVLWKVFTEPRRGKPK